MRCGIFSFNQLVDLMPFVSATSTPKRKLAGIVTLHNNAHVGETYRCFANKSCAIQHNPHDNEQELTLSCVSVGVPAQKGVRPTIIS